MKIIGLTGQSGAGKGAVAKIFSEHGIPHIDCDEIYHSMLKSGSECTKALVAEFGCEILDTDGSVDRKKLRNVVFSGEGHKERLKKLNEISHRFVLTRCRELLELYRDEGRIAVVVDAPTLFESGFDKECDVIVAVTAPYEVRIKRITDRDGLPVEKVKERFENQLSESFFAENAHYVIENDLDISALKKKTEEFIRENLI